jgi:hypothetical protein
MPAGGCIYLKVGYLFIMHMCQWVTSSRCCSPLSKLAEAFYLQGETDLDGATHGAALSLAGGKQVPGAQDLPRKPHTELALAREFLSSAVTEGT